METPKTKQRIKKYTDYLTEFNERVKSGDAMRLKELVAKYNVDSQVNTAIINVGYAKEIKKGKFISRLKSVEPIHGRIVTEELTKMGRARNRVYTVTHNENTNIDEEKNEPTTEKEAVVENTPKVFINGKEFTGNTLYIYIMRGEFFYSDNGDEFKRDCFPQNTH